MLEFIGVKAKLSSMVLPRKTRKSEYTEASEKKLAENAGSRAVCEATLLNV